VTAGGASPEQITAASRSSFLVSFAALDPERRAALSAVYAFCRSADDAVDEAPDPPTARRQLEFWRQELARAERGEASTGIGRALTGAMRRFGVPRSELEQVLDGIAEDVEPGAFATLADLERYCHRVAGAVGLACLPIFGAEGDAARRYAIELGHALQLVNVLRDLRADAQRGRLRVPAELLARHGVDAAWLAGGGPPDAYAGGGPVARLAADLAARARTRFAAAAAALPQAGAARLFAPRVMAAVYTDLLRRLERRGGRLDGPPARVPRWRKLWLYWRERLRR
jgi:phytoene synthase